MGGGVMLLEELADVGVAVICLLLGVAVGIQVTMYLWRGKQGGKHE